MLSITSSSSSSSSPAAQASSSPAVQAAQAVQSAQAAQAAQAAQSAQSAQAAQAACTTKFVITIRTARIRVIIVKYVDLMTTHGLRVAQLFTTKLSDCLNNAQVGRQQYGHQFENAKFVDASPGDAALSDAGIHASCTWVKSASDEEIAGCAVCDCSEELASHVILHLPYGLAASYKARMHVASSHESNANRENNKRPRSTGLDNRSVGVSSQKRVRFHHSTGDETSPPDITEIGNQTQMVSVGQQQVTLQKQLYKCLYGKLPAGRMASDIDWLKRKNKEARERDQ